MNKEYEGALRWNGAQSAISRQMYAGDNAYTQIREVNDSIENLIGSSLTYHGDNPSTEQKALDGIATVTLRELGNRTRTISAQNDHIRQLDQQLVAAYKGSDEQKRSYEALYTSFRQADRERSFAEGQLEIIMDFLLKPDTDRVPYADVPLLVAAFIVAAKDNGTYDKTTFDAAQKYIEGLSKPSPEKGTDGE